MQKYKADRARPFPLLFNPDTLLTYRGPARLTEPNIDLKFIIYYY